MPVNLEIKVPVQSFTSYKKRLHAINARFSAVLRQKDIYFKVPNGILKLRAVNETRELIFYKRAETARKRWSNYNVLPLPGAASETFFSKLFLINTTVIKTRELFIFGDTRIHLDVVRGLGKFIELESVVTASRKKAEREFSFVLHALQLPIEKEIRNSYLDLMLAKGE